jgi:methylmalonyl-CoA epimerase
MGPIPTPSCLDHVAIAVRSLAEAAPLYERMQGVPGSPPEEIPGQGVRVVFIGTVELLEPTGPETPVGRFLAKRGPGLHHIAWRVPDLPVALAELEATGMRLVDRAPRAGARGHRVAFLHPSTTGGVLMELVEALEPLTPVG